MSPYFWPVVIMIGFLAVSIFTVWLTFNFRREVCVIRKLYIDASPIDVFLHLDPGQSPQNWRPAIDNVSHLPGTQEAYRFDWKIIRIGSGPDLQWSQKFITTSRVHARHLRLECTDYEDGVTDERLMWSEAHLSPHGVGTTLEWREQWGKRSLAGWFVTHADVAESLDSFKKWCETGNLTQHRPGMRSMLISILSAVATFAAFSLLLGWQLAALFVIVLVVHEVGHLLSFRIVGQPWGRIMFVPFIGAVAISRLPHTTLAADVFCALMGAGLSIILLLPAMIFELMGYPLQQALDNKDIVYNFYALALLTGGINLLNLLPVFPLDGGRVCRAFAQSTLPNHVKPIMFFIAGMLVIAGAWTHNILLAAVSLITFFQSKRLTPPRPEIKTLSMANIAVYGLFFLALLILHGMAIYLFWPVLVV